MERKKSVELLESYLKNKGRFSVLLYGDRGTGKSFALEELQRKIMKSNLKDPNSFCLGGIVTKNAYLIDSTIEFWNDTLQEADGKILVIEDVEDLSRRNQELLLQILSTKDGKFGLNEKTYRFRPVFISCYSLDLLKEKLENKFFDRIAQLMVKFPSFSECQSTIWDDFKNTWNKMQFPDANKLPNSELKEWLEESACDVLRGNFRDLDKIVINWHNHRMLKTEEKDILEIIKSGFKEDLSYPKYNEDRSNVFAFSREYKGTGVAERKFKYAYKLWLTKEFGSLKEGCKKMRLSHRTVEGWGKNFE
ncbi:MAG: ATP-binding protein [Labilibaculum sp.]|nr:ATP-binding protein [Labilibaculum sp.]MBI9056995.1 ATP-binding protein [Labilibaculum sp.]